MADTIEIDITPSSKAAPKGNAGHPTVHKYGQAQADIAALEAAATALNGAGVHVRFGEQGPVEAVLDTVAPGQPVLSRDSRGKIIAGISGEQSIIRVMLDDKTGKHELLALPATPENLELVTERLQAARKGLSGVTGGHEATEQVAQALRGRTAPAHQR